jgi:hypothetical protein
MYFGIHVRTPTPLASTGRSATAVAICGKRSKSKFM